MNLAQRKIRQRLVQRVRTQEKECRALERLNQAPENQHHWDEWVRAEGRLLGLGIGLETLDAFIAAETKPKKVRKK